MASRHFLKGTALTEAVNIIGRTWPIVETKRLRRSKALVGTNLIEPS